jgi:starvation-inducible DNA-binding protein
MTDDIAERAPKLGGATLRSIYDIVQHQRLKDDSGDQVDAHRMLLELRADKSAVDGLSWRRPEPL